MRQVCSERETQAELLRGRSLAIPGSGSGADYAAQLLHEAGARVLREAGDAEPHPDLLWADTGAMALTGWPQAAPLLAPGRVAACARGALAALRCLAGASELDALDAAALLGERAAMLGLSRQGNASPGGSCRLLPAADGRFALNLARPEDVRLLPAWLEAEGPDEPWRFVAERAAGRSVAELVERGRLLGLGVAAAKPPSRVSPPWLRVAHCGPPRPSRTRPPLVIDLSSLWAGPLCTHLLARAGARVIKLESLSRPDGTRAGPRQFFDLLNAGNRSVALDFSTDPGRRQLQQLLRAADIVVESARPRALRQLGVEAERLVEEVPGLTWVGISGYGRREPGANWVAFGDDAGVAAGLTVATPRDAGSPVFCGDAIADPLTGLHAAVAALASWSTGGGHLLDLSLWDVAAHVVGFGEPAARAEVRAVASGWEVSVDGEDQLVRPPRARAVAEQGPELGADTTAILRELEIPC